MTPHHPGVPHSRCSWFIAEMLSSTGSSVTWYPVLLSGDFSTWFRNHASIQLRKLPQSFTIPEMWIIHSRPAGSRFISIIMLSTWRSHRTTTANAVRIVRDWGSFRTRTASFSNQLIPQPNGWWYMLTCVHTRVQYEYLIVKCHFRFGGVCKMRTLAKSSDGGM